MTKSRVHRVTIDEEGVHVREDDFTVRFPASDLEPVAESQITAAANAHGFYGEEADRFCREVDNATEFLIGTVSAPRRDRRRMKRAERHALKVAAMRHAGVPEETIAEWESWVTWLLSFCRYVAPFPWNVVIAAVVVAVERFLGGDA